MSTFSDAKTGRRTSKFLLCCVLLSALSLIMTGRSQAKTLQVPGEHATIQAGIDAAVEGDSVLVASGTYSGTGNIDLDFKGKAITVSSVSGPTSTIIDCQGQGRALVFQNGEGLASRFAGFTIKNGYVDINSRYGGKGGGIYCYNSSPTISDCIISNCSAAGFGGGGIILYGSSARVENTIIEYNTAETCGGGLLITVTSSPTIYNSIIRYNNTSSYSSGGGICVVSSSPTISYCTISHNEANIDYIGSTSTEITNSGGISFRDGSAGRLESSIVSDNKAQERGGIGNWDASPTIINTLIENNEATINGGGGIGLYFNSNAMIAQSTIRNNIAKTYGGGVSVWYETASTTGPSFSDSVIEGNTAGESSGGVNVFNASLTMSRSIVRQNSSPIRAGIGLKANNGTTSSVFVNDLIYDNDATGVGLGGGGGLTLFTGANATLTNCTIANNSSDPSNLNIHGGVHIYQATASIANSIVWGNLPSASPLTGATITYSDVSDGYSGPGNNNIEETPLFTSATDFHLADGSPCIDAGDNSAAYVPTNDLGGNDRVDGIVDMGAYEYPFTSGGPGVSGKLGAEIPPYAPPTPPAASQDNISVLFLLLFNNS